MLQDHRERASTQNGKSKEGFQQEGMLELKKMGEEESSRKERETGEMRVEKQTGSRPWQTLYTILTNLDFARNQREVFKDRSTTPGTAAHASIPSY